MFRLDAGLSTMDYIFVKLYSLVVKSDPSREMTAWLIMTIWFGVGVQVGLGVSCKMLFDVKFSRLEFALPYFAVAAYFYLRYMRNSKYVAVLANTRSTTTNRIKAVLLVLFPALILLGSLMVSQYYYKV